MQAAVIDGYGGNEVVMVRDVPEPVPGAKEVLIRVRAASVNPVDWKIRSGQLRLLTGRRFPQVLGLECAGEVVACGAGVHGYAPGDAVVAFTGIRRRGAFAEYVCAPEKGVFRMLPKLSFADAATLPIAGLTALQSLRRLGRLRAADRVLINGASGGVGTFAVQIARECEARVTAVCSAGNADLVRELGADRVIDYARHDFTEGSERYALIFDAVGKSTFARSKRALARDGIYVSTLPSPSTLLNNCLTGLLTRKKAHVVMVQPNAIDMTWLQGRIEVGNIRVVIDRTCPLAQIREAFARSETGRARGKVVLMLSEG